MTWDKEAVLCDLQQHPPAPPQINWQKFEREHDIPGAGRLKVPISTLSDWTDAHQV